MTLTYSSQEFIRSLKASSDPPAAGRPAKIQIARQAWDDNAFYLPSKAEVIVEWILSTLLKDKVQHSSASSIFNENYWKLLLDILQDKKPADARSLRTWLTPLLHRISLQPVLSAFLAKYREVGACDELAASIASCVTILWPISVQKTSLENLADLFGLLLQKADDGHLTLGIINIGILVTSSYRTSLGNSVNKKKFYQLFLQSFFPRWLRALSQSPTPTIDLSPEHTHLYQNIYDTGTDTLFNLDILRQLSENRPTDQWTALFEHLRTARSSPSEGPSTLLAIPRLFLSYVQAVKRHRGAVFSQSSGVAGIAALNDEVSAASMRFFANCEVVVSGGHENGGKAKEVGVWSTRLRLLESVLDEKLFNVRQESAVAVLNVIVEDAVGVLSYSWKGEHKDVISLAVKCLHKIGHIDCDLLLPSLPRILPSLLPISITDPAPSTFLDLILDYHTKTRTLNTYITILLNSLTPTSFPSSGTTDIRGIYESCFSGHILNGRNLGRLGNAIRRFLTPGQTLRSVEELLRTLGSSWQTLFNAAESKGDHGESPKKKIKEATEVEENVTNAKNNLSGLSRAQDTEYLAASFALQAQLALIVLSNLPMQSLNEDSVVNVQNAISEFRESVVVISLKKLLKTKRLLPGGGKKKRRRESLAGQDGWSLQVTAAAMLRVHYALGIAKVFNDNKQNYSSGIYEQAKDVMAKEGGKGNLTGELELEAYRALLHYVSEHNVQQDEALQIFDSILSYLNGTFKPSDSTWSGLPCLLKTPQSGALAVLHLILERWLPLVDRLASPSQLNNIIQLILSIKLDPISITTGPSLRPDHLFLRLLRSAEFWEMHHFRSAFLSHLVQITSSHSQNQESEVVAYRLLLYVPAEYLTKMVRAHLVNRAYTADIQLVGSLNGEADKYQEMEQRKSVLVNLITLRVFLKRVIEHVGFDRVSDVDLGDYIVHLMSFDYRVEGLEYKTFVESTLDLIELCFDELLRNQNSHSTALLKVITSFNQYPALVNTSDAQQNLQSRAITNLLNVVTKLRDTSSLTAECISSIQGFYGHLSKTISHQLQHISKSRLTGCSEVLTGWCCVLRLRKWLDEIPSEENHQETGRNFVSLALQELGTDERLDDVRVSIFAILRAEFALLMQTTDKQRQLELIIAAFIAFRSVSTGSAREQLDEHISSISKGLIPDDYSYVLDLLSESLTSHPASTEDLETVVHLSILFLRDHPQHTLKYVQSFATHCLNTFAGSRVFTDGAIPLRLLTLEFVVQHCSDRPAALRTVDIGSIWTILFKFLEPSDERDAKATPEIFHKIIASVNALVRLRRDLLTPILPHLGLILRRLLSSMRGCRPQLGAKQTAMVMRTQPRWISARQPLGLGEGRMLSRLLETLNMKTTIRNHMTNETQKAESLGKPFSKHAAYVLAAYIEALNEPLCVFNVEIRRELEPGIFILCGLMGEHARDALVVSLDANGKAALKLIWKEYEKQRYVGRG